MQWDQIEDNWKIYRGHIKQEWGQLTDEDLNIISGKRDQLIGRLQNRYGFPRNEAERQVVNFLSRGTPAASGTRMDDAEPITQLGGAPDLNPIRMTQRSHSEYVEGSSMIDMIQEDLVAERVAIDSYSEFIRYLGDDDPTTRRMLEEILAVEEKHADELKKMLQILPA